jgi:hypothetical protein
MAEEKEPTMPLHFVKIPCAWRGCKKTAHLCHPPKGWRYLNISSEETFADDKGIYFALYAALCPKHYQELIKLFKDDPLFKEGKGNIKMEKVRSE